jgi:amino acid adenylation domain-containing protein
MINDWFWTNRIVTMTATSSLSEKVSRTGCSTFVDLLRARARLHPERVAYVFLSNGETEETTLTYGELDQQARAVAAGLQSSTTRGDRVLLLYPPGIEYITAFFGCLYAGVIAVPAYPPRNNRNLLRLQSLIADAQPTLALTTSSILSRVAGSFARDAQFGKLRWLTSEGVAASASDDWSEPGIGGDDLAFLQYTSGSTATPKGVMLSQSCLLHNDRLMQRAFRQTESSVIVGWLPLYHDMGLIGIVLHSLSVGARAILMSPIAFLQQPYRWLQTISQYRATTSGGPNFSYDLCVRKISEEQRASLDLSSWTVAFNGAEPVRAETLDRFAEAFGPCGFRREAFRPCYGLAEATLIVSAADQLGPQFRSVSKKALEHGRVVDDAGDDRRRLVGCGGTLLDQVVVVDPESLAECRPGEVGEIWVSGPSVAKGYWNNPDETARTFQAALDDRSFLRTGDLGAIQDGELYLTGRLKDLIILRGRNHYPQDIELTVEQCDASLRAGCGAAFSVSDVDEERLVIVQEIELRRAVEVESIFGSIRGAISTEHETQVSSIVLIKPGTIPKTSSGKIQRGACRRLYLKGELEVVAEWRAGAEAVVETVDREEGIEDWLRAEFAELLKVPSINVHEPIMRYGLDSLSATELTHRIETRFGVTAPLTALLENPTIAQLAAFIENTATIQMRVSDSSETRNEYPLSYGQQSLWFLHRLAPDSAAYNLATAIRMRGLLDVAALDRAFTALVQRHATLRTTFSEDGDAVVQRVHESAPSFLEYVDASFWSDTIVEERVTELAHQPFDLVAGPVLRVVVLKRSDREHVLLFVVHHIGVDFWSLALLMKELGTLYEADCRGVTAGLQSLPLQYSDHVRGEAVELGGARGEQLWAYWRTQLSGDLPVLNLPADRPRPTVQTFRGASVGFEINARLMLQLKQLARDHEATLYMVLLAAFQTLLHRYTQQSDFIIGSPSAGRKSAKLASVVGYFVNTLALRAGVGGNPSFAELLSRTRRTVLDAFAHQDFPFPLLVERLSPERDASRTPLFQHMFVMQQSDFEGLAPFALGNSAAQLPVGELVLETVAFERRVSLFDLKLEVAEAADMLLGSMEYNTDLFDAATIDRIIGNFQTLLESIVDHPNQRLSRQTLLTPREEHQLLIEWNDTAAEYAQDICLHQFFESQALRTPDAIALISGNERLTYGELNTRANQLAHRLLTLGAGPETLVGVLLERSPSLIVALLGVLKSGAASVPLDPAYPGERIRFMLEDAGIKVLLTQQSLRNDLPPHNAHVVCLDGELIDEETGQDLSLGTTHPSNLAYVIYTSGSTGRPKGVAIEHHSAATLIQWARQRFTEAELRGVLASTSVCFDLSIFEIFVPLSTGGTAILANNALELPDLAAAGEVTLINTVPSAMAELLRMGGVPDSVRVVNLAGEPLSHELAQRIYELPAVHKVFNLYGPSEDTTYSTWAMIDRNDACAPTIGRPIANTQIYLLDAEQQPVPIGVIGELYISGDGVVRGYFNRPGQTAEKFLPNPFSTEPGARMYRTGDLARYLPDGRIEFLGRMDHQVKLRGFRIELGEIESALRKHEAVRDCVVTTSEVAPGDPRLIAYVVYERELTNEALRRHLKHSLPDYMIPSYFVDLTELPLSPNGKIDRRALPVPTPIRSGLAQEFVPPRNELEQLVQGIWQAVLGVERVGIHDNFFELGGHSLLATQIVARINLSFKIDFPLRRMFETPTVAGLAEALADSAESDGQQPIERVSRGAALPLSFAQQRLWFLEQLEPGNSAYNMPIAIRLSGSLAVEALERSIQTVIDRHEVLRTSITNVSGNPMQLIAELQPWRLQIRDLSGDTEAWFRAMNHATEEAHRSFDLSQAPLLRAVVWRLDATDHLLLLVMHHIISDGWSVGVFASELTKLYKAFAAHEPSPLPDLPIQYSDFAQWQRQHLLTETPEQLAYWKRQLAGELPVLELPSERSRMPAPDKRVASESWTTSKSLNAKLRDLSRNHDATLFMTVLTALQVLLHRYTGLDDILIGTPVAGRTRVETEDLIGLFANTLVLRGDLTGDPSFVDLLARVRQMTLEAHMHQDVPFELLVEELQPERDLNRTPLFQVMIVLQNAPLSKIELPGLDVQQIELTSAAPKFDLILFLKETRDELHGTWEYNTERLDQHTVRRMAQHFLMLLENIVSNPLKRISDLRLLPAAEQQQLIEWNDTTAKYPRHQCLHELIEQQAARTPDAVALIAGAEQVTYRELNEQANQLAHHLRKLGCGPESLVAVLMERSPSLVVALLAVLKAGGAYIPLDPAYPSERVRLTLEDSHADLLLTDEVLHTSLPAIHAHSRENLNVPIQSSQLAYVIYTSGSTGRPKGVAIEHQSAVTFIHWSRDVFTDQQLAGVLASTSICFDLSIFEIFVPLATGGTVILAANALELPLLAAAHQVTLINTVPSAMTELVRMAAVPESVRVVNLAGEALKGSLVQKIYELDHVEQVFNLYGPTEDTTYSTWTLIENDRSQPTIGRPIANTQAYVLDAHQQRVPIGITGELYLGGAGLARGYLNNPALTAERFIPDPFPTEPGGRMYRTGDLARYLSDGRIEYLGRSDHQVKLRGFRIELGEIETILATHTTVQDAVVIARQNPDTDQQLVAYVVAAPDQTVESNTLRAYLHERLPKHMVPAFIVPLAALPLTPNGKLDRRRLPAAEASEDITEDVASPRTIVEAKVARLWTQLLNRRQISIHEDFFSLGGHSLLAVQVVSRLQEEFQIELPIRSIFENSTVAALANVIENARQASQPPIAAISRTGPLPVSFAQQRLWLLDQLAPDTSAYNILGGMHLRGDLDVAAFEDALNAIVARHEILRTTFSSVDGRPVQIIADAQRISPKLIDLRNEPADERETKLHEFANDELNRPFNLSRGPLMRVGLVQLADDEHVALVTMHHIISDGWSINVFVNEFIAFYKALRNGDAPDLAALPIQYADYTNWQRERLREGERDGEIARQLDYWRRKLSGPLPLLELPADYPRTGEPALRGERLTQKLSPELSQSLRDLSRREGVTLYMTLLAAFNALLYRSTNQHDVIVGTAIAGRNRAEVENLIGIFINMLVLRNDLSGNPTFLELLARVRNVTLEAYAHQNVPFERLVEALQPARVLSRSPFFQIAFGVDYQPVQKFTLPDLELSPINFPTELSRYDLTLWVFENDAELTASWTVNTDLFKPETIARMQARFETLLSSIVKNPETRLLALELFSDDEKQQAENRQQEWEESNVRKLMSVKRRPVKTFAGSVVS